MLSPLGDHGFGAAELARRRGEALPFRHPHEGLNAPIAIHGSRDSSFAEQSLLCHGPGRRARGRRRGMPIIVSSLETERGYSTQIMSPLRHSIIWPARACMVTPTSGGIRVGGTVEMAGLDPPPDYRRATILGKRARAA